MAKQLSQMVRGMGVALRFITLLTEEINAAGGHNEMLHFLTTELGSDNLKKVAAFIASLKWRVPKSVVMRLVRNLSLKDYGNDYVESDEHFWWELALNQLGVPFVAFDVNSENTDEGCRWPIPEEVREQLEGKPATAAMIVVWEDRTYILVGLGYVTKNNPKVGEPIDTNDIHFIHLSLAHYFDLEN